MSVVVSNPRFDFESQQQPAQAQPGFFKRNAGAFKGLMLIGVVGVVGAVGYVVGSQTGGASSSEPESSASSMVVKPVSAEMAVLTVEKAAVDEGDQLWDFLKIDAYDGLVDRYEQVGADEWKDKLMPANIMESLKFLRDTHRAEEAETKERQLQAAHDEALAAAAWNAIESETYSSPDTITWENDRAIVKKQNGYCFIVAEETNAANDWGANLNLGTIDVLAVGGSGRVGRGYRGFVEAYNAMRNDIWNQKNAKCSSTDTVVLAGYSRGAGILQAMALAVTRQGLHSTSRLKMVTFGAPRCLTDADADFVHGRFEQIRIVKGRDPVPSIPYPWMGFKHFSPDMVCYGCNYSEGRDKPSWAWFVDGGIADHTSYGDLYA